MKRVLSLFLFVSLVNIVFAQEPRPTLRFGAAYAHDFPGLNGITGSAEFVHPLIERFEGGLGLKRVHMQGSPRTHEVTEYTKATTLDLNLYFLPVQLEQHNLRIGMGYSYTFYKIQRSFPTMNETGDKVSTWNVLSQKGKGRGFGFSLEYEYLLPESNISFGVRAAIYKAYDQVTGVGPFIGLRI